MNAGLLKIMSKMGISVLSSYRGGCNFETVGLSRTIVDDYFPGVTSKISGIGLTGIEKKIRQIHKEAFESTDTVLPIGGIYRYRKNGEHHQYQGQLIHMLQNAVTTNSYEIYKKYAYGRNFYEKSAYRKSSQTVEEYMQDKLHKTYKK